MRTKALPLLAGIALLGAAAAAGAASSYVGVSGNSEGPVAGAPATNYVLRMSYIVPKSLKAEKARKNATTRRFGPLGSCKIKMTVKARAVADVADETPVARVTRLLPATSRYVREEGTRSSAAWRVIRESDSKRTLGILTRRAPTVRTQPTGKRVWLELRAVGTPDPTTECHAGGPRRAAAIFGLMFASGSLGGFEPSR